MTRGIANKTGHGNLFRHGEIQWISGKRKASPEYISWSSMKDRCLNRRSKNYPNCEWATRQRQARNRAYVKLSKHKAALIRAAYVPGQIRQIDLARRFGVSQRTICLVVRGEGWRI